MSNDNLATVPDRPSRLRRRGLAVTAASAAILGAVTFGVGTPAASAAVHTGPGGNAAISLSNQNLSISGIAWDYKAYNAAILTCVFDNNRPLACTRTNARHLFTLRATLAPGQHRVRVMAYNSGNNNGQRTLAAEWMTARAAAPSWINAYTGARRIAASMLASYGWGANQMPALVALWNRESGWNPAAYNAGSGAYGIPQALPGSKMASAGADWRTNPATQIRWGLSYIKGVYGSPAAAWGHSQATGWY
jgi:Transglycosylase SLT domain